MKAGRAEYRGEEKAEGQESQEGYDVERVEGDAQLNLAMHLEEPSFNAPLTLC